jgi:pimeloyl-ACP methyl ester carboxylesterase
VGRLVLRVPTDVDPAGFADRPQEELAGDRGLAWKSAVHTPEDSPALAAAAGFRGPAWLVSSGRDQIVPWQTTENYLAAFPADRLHHVHLPSAGHSMLGHVRDFLGVLVEASSTTV